MQHVISLITFTLLLTACSCGSDKPSLQEALSAEDFTTVNELLVDGYNQYSGIPNYVRDTYIPDAMKVLKTEASFLLDKEEDAETTKLFLLCINDVASNLGNQQFAVGRFTGRENPSDNEYYIEEVTPYNATLVSIIREACLKGNRDFAKKVVKFLKPNYKCSKKLLPQKSGSYNSHYVYTYSVDNSAMEEADKIIATQY